MAASGSDRIVAVIGLGYVGLPVAVAFAKAGMLGVGFDIDPGRIDELRRFHDRTHEVGEVELRAAKLLLSADPAALRSANFFIVTVPTPIDGAKNPDLSMILAASRLIGKSLKRGDIVVYESTVYPGATEEDCRPVLEAESGLVAGRDFFLGYSPERINPGDPTRRFETIKKVVAGQDAATLAIISDVYGRVVGAGIHQAPSIRVAEAAKVIENIQRDLNIALMNELARIFARLDIDTGDVLAAAGTKWNFLPFTPGLVGGHCIGVDPYYLTHRAARAGYDPEIILAGRKLNDDMAAWIARECVKRLLKAGNGRRVTVLGLTFKENVPDIRNSKVIDLIRELQAFDMQVAVHDPLADAAECWREYGVRLAEKAQLLPADAVILAVPHAAFLNEGWGGIAGLLAPGGGLVMDIKARLPREAKPDSLTLWRL